MRPAALALWLALAFLLAAPLAAQQEALNGDFRVVSWVGPEVARQAVAHLERTKALYEEIGFYRRRPALPLTVLLLPDQTDLAPYVRSQRRAETSRGLSFIGDDGAFILVAWNAPGSPWTALAHEYAHLVDPEPDGAAWFREGFAEYLSSLRRNAEGDILPAAAPLQARELLSQPWIPLDPLLAATRRDEAFGEPLFYAQSWLMVDWLAAEGVPAAGLREATLRRRLAALGGPAFELKLRARASQLALAEPVAEAAPPAAPLPATGARAVGRSLLAR